MKAFKTWVTLAAVAGSLAACSMPQEIDPGRFAPSQKTRIYFSASSLETKTAFADPTEADGTLSYPTLWTENDTEVAVSLNFSAAVPATVFPSEDHTRADFAADFDDVASTPAPYSFLTLSPSSALEAVSKSRSSLTVNIPSVQTPLPNSVDEAAQLLFGKTENLEEIPEKVDVHLTHLTGYGRLTLKNLPENVTVSSVSLISSEQPWAGSWYYNTEDGSIEAKEASSTITVNTDASGDIWFACAPVDMKGKKLKISVATDAGAYEKEITLTSKNVDFTSGHVYKFSVNMDGIEPVKNTKVYRLVTDASALQAGKEVLIVYTSGSLALGTSGSNNRAQVAVTINSSVIDGETLPAAVQVLSLEAGSSSGSWSFSTGSGYLRTTNSTRNNYLQTSTTKDGWSSWKVTISDSGEAMICSVSSSSNYYKQIRYNKSSSLFSAYRSTSNTSWNSTTTGTYAVSIYMEDYVGGPAADDPILEEETYGAYLNAGKSVYAAGADQLSREYNGENVTFAILNPVEYTIYEFSGIPQGAKTGDSFTLTFALVRGKNEVSSVDYPVTVVGESGAKLWLSAGSGQGFIVKR